MNELRNICAAFAENIERGQRSALATIVSTSDSSHRRAGARMLIAEDGHTAGAVIGDFLDADVINRAISVIESGQPMMLSFDARSQDDLIRGWGIGYYGVVEILIERLTDGPANEFIEFLSFCESARTANVLATVVGVAEGAQDVRIGDRLMMSAIGIEYSQITNFALALQIEKDALAALDEGRSRTMLYASSDDAVKVFIEVIRPTAPMRLYGARADSQAVGRFANELG